MVNGVITTDRFQSSAPPSQNGFVAAANVSSHGLRRNKTTGNANLPRHLRKLSSNVLECRSDRPWSPALGLPVITVARRAELLPHPTTYWRHPRSLGCRRWISTRTGRDGQWRHHCSRQANARRCARKTATQAGRPWADVSGDGAAAYRYRQRGRATGIHPVDRVP
jgi:hypothetical protein